MPKDVFLEPINDYTFGRGIQKGSHGKSRWWYCREENVIAPDFELSKLGVVEELMPDVAMEMLKAQGEDIWNKTLHNYPTVAPEMLEWERR